MHAGTSARTHDREEGVLKFHICGDKWNKRYDNLGIETLVNISKGALSSVYTNLNTGVYSYHWGDLVDYIPPKSYSIEK